MSVSSVPPGWTSPYQKGEGEGTKAESSKLRRRHAVASGVEASVRPLRSFQTALVLKTSAASAGLKPSDRVKAIARIRIRFSMMRCCSFHRITNLQMERRTQVHHAQRGSRCGQQGCTRFRGAALLRSARVTALAASSADNTDASPPEPCW